LITYILRKILKYH